MKIEIEEKQIEAPYELPEGWKWCRLPECVSIVTGKKDANYGTPDGKYLFFTCAEQPLRCDDYSFKGESLLLPGNGANVGQVIYYDGQFEVYQRTYVLQKTNELILLKYLYYHILGFWKNYNLDKQYGSATNYIKMGNFLNYYFPLPPTLAEQQRIVNRIESMFAKLDEAKERAQNVVDGFETRKAAILHKAFTGELTAKWRKENGVSDDSWEEKTIGEICLVKGGKRVPKGMSLIKEKNEHPYLKAGNLKFGTVIDKDMEYVPNDVFILIKNYTVNAGDVYITNVGACIGDCGIIPDYYHGASLTENAVKLTEMICNNSYLAKQLSSNLVQTQIKSKIKSATLGKLSIDNIKQLKINLPTLPEQQEIVRILDIIIGKERIAKQAAEAVLEQIDLLKKSILARAFRGEL